MGVVYLAHDPVIDRPVAVKVLRTTLDDEEMRERFAREVRATGALVHRNIVTVYDAGEHSGLPFIAMEFVDGRSTQEIIQKQEPLSLDARLALVEDLCCGLAYAHTRGLIHRDIKPGNLMVGYDGVLRILDFGIARLMDASRASFTTVGTPGYMSPEQILGDRVDHRSDLFAVGLVLYELLTYKRAFPGAALPRIMHAVLYEEPMPLRDAMPGLNEGLIAIVEKALRKNPEERYADGVTMATDVRAARVRLLGGDAYAATVPPIASLATVKLDGPPPPTPIQMSMPTPMPMATPTPASTPPWMVTPTPMPMPMTPGMAPPARGRSKWPIAMGVALLVLGVGALTGYLAAHRQHAVEAAPPSQRDPELRWVNIPAGKFLMGCVPGDSCAADEQPRHEVHLSHAFVMLATEVTWAQYRRYAQSHGVQEPTPPDYPVKNDLPVVNVNWDEALAFCKASGGRLPTEAELEYAARAGQAGWKRGWGNGDPMINGRTSANLADETYRRTTNLSDADLKRAKNDPLIWVGYDDGFAYPAPAASFIANAFGLYDMSGNVREWIADYDHATPDDYRQPHHANDPVGPPTGRKRGVRGDAYDFHPKWSRLSAREFIEPDRRENDIGFRCAR
jgi:formylglycine-generating enzyme required for sulfatase activity